MRGVWVAQWVKCLTLDFSSGDDLRTMTLSYSLGSGWACCLLKTLSLLSLLPTPSLKKKKQNTKNPHMETEVSGQL